MDVTETGERSLDGGAAGFSETSFLTLEQEGRSYGIFLPDPDDHIQKGIRRTGEPYELEMLRDMRMRLAPGDLVLDVGANVGNHALYLAAVAGARVIAFEPNEHLAEALEASVARNTLEDWIQVSAAGLGASAGTAGFARSVPDNLGAQTLVLGKGEITVTTLDSLGIEGPARAIKIDVEGMEIDVLRGGVDLIDRDRPVLYVESHSEACFREVAHFVREHGYTYWETFNTTPTHLFLPAEHVSLDRRLEFAQDARGGAGIPPAFAAAPQSQGAGPRQCRDHGSGADEDAPGGETGRPRGRDVPTIGKPRDAARGTSGARSASGIRKSRAGQGVGGKQPKYQCA